MQLIRFDEYAHISVFFHSINQIQNRLIILNLTHHIAKQHPNSYRRVREKKRSAKEALRTTLERQEQTKPLLSNELSSKVFIIEAGL